jgi:hypothetical protein
MEDCLFAIEVLRGPHFSGLYDEQCANVQLVGQWNAEDQKLQRKYEKLALQQARYRNSAAYQQQK